MSEDCSYYSENRSQVDKIEKKLDVIFCPYLRAAKKSCESNDCKKMKYLEKRSTGMAVAHGLKFGTMYLLTPSLGTEPLLVVELAGYPRGRAAP